MKRGTRNALSLLAFAAGFSVAIALDAFWIEPASLHVAEYDVALAKPGPLAGLRVAVIADLHGGAPFIDEAKIARVVELTNATRPDLILLTGDYVITGVRGGTHMPVETIVGRLKALAAPLGVYAVLGNHDIWEDGPRIASVFNAAGIRVLDNASRTIETPRGPFDLAGIGDFYTHNARPTAALATVAAGRVALCFTHSPDVFPELPQTCTLTIAGHTHGGQVALPLIGRPIVPSRYGQRYAAGLIREDGKALFVATGIGTSIFPIRLGVPPEISVLEIH